MKNSLLIISCLLALIFSSCQESDPNEQVDEGSVKGEMYTSEEIGWTIEIPNGWDVISKDKLDENTDKGMEIVEELAGGEVDYSGLKHLISFQKDPFNIFQSTSEPFPIEYEGEWEEKNKTVKEIIYAAYTNQGINIDTSSTTSLIDGLEFTILHITVYNPKGEVILNQEMYSRWINGFDFAVNINYNNPKDRNTMLSILKNSKFKKG